MRVMITVFSYGLSSLSGVFVNKACLSAYEFNHPLTLLLSQLTVSLTCLTVCRSLGLITIVDRPVHDLPQLLLPTVSFVLNVTIGLVALRLVNIPMFSAFRRLSVLAVMLVEHMVLRTVPSRRVFSAVFVMAFGSFLAGLGDVSYDPVGYLLVFMNNFITAGNLVAIKKCSNALSLSALSMFYYVSLLALPMVTVLAVVTGDLRSALRDIFCTRIPELQSPGFIFAMSCSAASAFLINFFTNLCTQMTSPLTTAITGQMKNILQTVLGIFAFGYVVTPLNLFGLAVALTGSLLFARIKYVDGQTRRKQAAAAAAAKASDVESLPSPSPLSHTSQGTPTSKMMMKPHNGESMTSSTGAAVVLPMLDSMRHTHSSPTTNASSKNN